jgi:hypothetical protein
VAKFAETVFKIAPFVPAPLPQAWREILEGWLAGAKTADLQKIDETANEFVQDGVCYKLTWALEAVRVRASVGRPDLSFDGSLTAAIDVGALRIQEILLLRAGLRSRTAARQVVDELAPSFTTFKRMHRWVVSDEVTETLDDVGWPSAETAAEWRRFVQSNSSTEQLEWKEDLKVVHAKWLNGTIVHFGERLRLYTDSNGVTQIFNLQLDRLGELAGSNYERSHGPEVVFAGPGPYEVTVTSFGPER